MPSHEWAFPMPFRFEHLDRQWLVWKDRRSKAYFLEDDLGGQIGPYSDPKQAFDWVREIRPVN